MRPSLFALAALTAACLSAAPNIVVDGQIAEWTQVRPGFTSEKPDHLVRAVSVAADPYRIFILLSFPLEQQIHALPGSVTLLADSDGDSATGEDGFDVAFEFSSGVSVTTFDRGISSLVKTGVNDLGLAYAPSVAARNVEVGFPRGGSVGAHKNLFSGRAVRWKLIVRDDAKQVVQQGQFASKMPARRAWNPPEAKSDPLGKPPGANFRVLTWNVHDRNWIQNPELFRRTLQALQPDIVLLTEVSISETPEPWIRAFLKSLRPDGKDWNLLISKSGGWDRTVVATHFPLTPAFDEVRHNRATIERLGPLVEPLLPKSSPRRKDLEDGISAAAAFVTIGSRTLLATTIHLACCGNEQGSVREQRRQAEAEVIAERLRATIGSRRVDGVITGGDFNLVNTRRPIELLRSNLDPAGGPLDENSSRRLDGWATWTWRAYPGAATPFMRSRLDYLLYSPSRLEQRKAFVFDPADMSSGWLLRHKLQADDWGSDHRPVVADFRWR